MWKKHFAIILTCFFFILFYVCGLFTYVRCVRRVRKFFSLGGTLSCTNLTKPKVIPDKQRLDQTELGGEDGRASQVR